jgi:hypothetical protein
MSFLFAILFFVFFIGLFILLTILGFIRSIFTFGRRKPENQQNSSDSYTQSEHKPKVFDKKEGEYVDFEEVE